MSKQENLFGDNLETMVWAQNPDNNQKRFPTHFRDLQKVFKASCLTSQNMEGLRISGEASSKSLGSRFCFYHFTFRKNLPLIA